MVPALPRAGGLWVDDWQDLELPRSSELLLPAPLLKQKQFQAALLLLSNVGSRPFIWMSWGPVREGNWDW